MDSRISTIELYRLDVQFRDDSIIHPSTFSGNQSAWVPEHTWKRENLIGAGGFGMVSLEREQKTQQVRAVKILSKSQLQLREIEAMIELRDASPATMYTEY